MSKFYIVWNGARNEAFVTNDENDANSVVTGHPHYSLGWPTESTVGAAFRESYEDDNLTVEEIEIPATT